MSIPSITTPFQNASAPKKKPSTSNPANSHQPFGPARDSVHLTVSQPKFSGKKNLKDDETEVTQLKAAINNLNESIAKGKANIALGGLIGGGVGTGVGSAGTFSVGGLDGGALTAASASALTPVGAFVAGGISRLKHGSVYYNEGQRDVKQDRLNLLEPQVTLGQSITKGLNTLKTALKTAIGVEGFPDQYYKDLRDGLASDYNEVERLALETKPLAGNVPGFADAYYDKTGLPFKDDGAFGRVKAALYTGNEATQALSLQRLYLLEGGNSQASLPIYHSFLGNNSPKVAATALQRMTKYPPLRGNERFYLSTIERFLARPHSEETKVDAALNAILATSFQSNNINVRLSEIANPGSPFSEDIRSKARIAQDHRFAQGTAQPLNAANTVERILDGLIGNDELQANLETALLLYAGKMQDRNNKGPALKLFLYGPSGIGKTTTVGRIQTELNNDPDGVVHIKMSDIRTRDQLIGVLKAAAPLQGKTIFLDEFQHLDRIEPVSEQANIIEFLKTMFDRNTVPHEQLHPLNEHYGINIKDTILAVATNKKLRNMECMQPDQIGEPLKSRIASSVSLDLQPDLRELIPQFVTNYFPKQYYQYAEGPKFSDTVEVSITDTAQNRIVQQLQQTLEEEDRISGRMLTDNMTDLVDVLIQRHETNNPPLRRDNGVITQSLTIATDEANRLVLIPKD